ncbi:MAG: SCO family protein [Kordia sp.]|nr:MAG: SCO family protein [Kordia sp.]
MKCIKTVLILMLVLVSCKEEVIDKSKVLPFFNSSDFTPEWILPSSDEYNEIHTISPFSFTNQNGKTITNNDYKDKIYVVDFFFTTCPGICPRLTKNMNILQEEFENDEELVLLSHTVMPWVDTVDKLKEFASNNKVIDSKWNLVTGERDEIYNIARNSYFADEDFVKTKDESAFIHTENFLLIDKKGRVRGVYNGTLEIETKRLLKHIELLKDE